MTVEMRKTPITPVLPQPGRTDRLEVDDVLQLIRRNLGMMALVVIAVVGLTLLYLSRQSDLYRAQAEMALTNSEIRISQIDAQLETYDLTTARVETQMDILRSRNFAEKVATDLNLFDNMVFLPPPEDGPARTPEARRRATLDRLMNSYSLHRSGESLVLTVQAEAPDAELAADIANGIVTGFIELSVENQAEVIEGSIEHLRQQVATLGEELSQREVELADFIREHALDDTEMPARLRRERSHMISVLEVMQNEPGRSGAEAQQIRDNLTEIEAQLAERTRNDLMLSRKQRYIDLLSTRYQTSIERLNELEPRRQMMQPEARQISVAEVPVEPAWPNRGPTLALAVVVGLVLAFVFALLREGLNHKVWDGAQATRISDLPNLGTLPRIRRRGMLSRNHDPVWFLRSFPRSAFAKSLRLLFTIWSSQSTDSAENRVLMVTSGVAGDGKSTVATSLAASAALDGLKVLLMDFDIQRGGASRILGIEAVPMPAETLIGGPLSDTLPQVLQHVDGFESLDMISFKGGTHWTPRLMRTLAQDVFPLLREAYDLIIIDTPPALAVADAVRFGSVVDEAMIVVRSGNTSERTLRNTVEKLMGGGVQIVGTVINDVEPHRYRQLNQGGAYGYY